MSIDKLSLDSIKASLLETVGTRTFCKCLRKLAIDQLSMELTGYCIRNANATMETFEWNTGCDCFSRMIKQTPRPESEKLSLKTIPDSTPSNLNKSESLVFEATLLKSIKIHHQAKDFQNLIMSKGLLTQREQEVLKLIMGCNDNKEIAALLKISQRTVEKHCQNIFEKLEVENRSALIHLVSNQVCMTNGTSETIS